MEPACFLLIMVLLVALMVLIHALYNLMCWPFKEVPVASNQATELEVNKLQGGYLLVTRKHWRQHPAAVSSLQKILFSAGC